MRHFTVFDKDNKKIRLSAPTSWDELSLKQFIQIEGMEENNVLGLFCILTGMDLTIAEKSKDQGMEKTVWQIVEFISKPPKWDSLIMPSMFQIGKGVYKTLLKYNELTVGQSILISQAVTDVEHLITKIPNVLAIIFQPIIDKGEFESKRLLEVQELLAKSNGLGAYCISRFFFQSSKHSKKYGMPDSTTYQLKKPPRAKLSADWLKLNALPLLENSNS